MLDPEFILLDEPTSALDLSVQGQVIDLLRDLQRRRGLTYLFISHDLKVVRALCHRVIVMCGGKVVETGDTDQIMDFPREDYTEAPRAGGARGRSVTDYLSLSSRPGTTRMTKIAMIGAGSTVFMKNLVGDILSEPLLKDCEISLMDIDEKRLATSRIVAERIAAAVDAHAEDHRHDRSAAGARGRRLRRADDPGRRLQARARSPTSRCRSSAGCARPSPTRSASAASCAACAPRRC